MYIGCIQIATLKQKTPIKMLKAIRNLNLGWIIILLGITGICSGISMTEGKVDERTFLCFDSGCIYVQGVSNIALGILCLGLGLYMILKK